MTIADYIDNTAVVKLRIFKNPCCKDWQLDGIDGKGGDTESCWEADTHAEAVTLLPLFAKDNAPHLLAPRSEA